MAYAYRDIRYNLTNSFFATSNPISDTGEKYSSFGSLVAWWRLDTDISSTGNATDYSGNGHTANPGERPGWPSPAVGPFSFLTPSGRLINFIQDNSNYFGGVSTGLTVASDDNISFTDGEGTDEACSFHFRFYGSFNDGAGAWYYIAEKGDTTDTNTEYRIYLYDSDGDEDAMLYLVLLDSDGDKIFARCAALDSDVWTDAVITYDGSKSADGIKMYIDGTEVSTTTGGSGTYDGMWRTGETLYVGSDGASANSFKGYLADVAMWNSELTAADALALSTISSTGAYRISRNFESVGSKVDPSITGSVAPFIQGINVDSYERFGSAITPLLCRSDPDTYFLSSSGGTRKIDVNQAFFDDSFRYPGRLAVSVISSSAGIVTGSTAIVEIGDDPNKLICVPSYFMELRSFGIEHNFGIVKPWQGMTQWDSVQYISEPDTMQWPVVLDNPSAIDPFEFSGVIEPLEIRKVITQLSTFMGNHQDPEPHQVRGMVNSGQLTENSIRDTFKMSNFYEPKTFVNMTPFEYITDVSLDVFESLLPKDPTTPWMTFAEREGPAAAALSAITPVATASLYHALTDILPSVKVRNDSWAYWRSYVDGGLTGSTIATGEYNDDGTEKTRHWGYPDAIEAFWKSMYAADYAQNVRLTSPNRWGRVFDYTSAVTSSVNPVADVEPFDIFPGPQITTPNIFRRLTSGSIPYDLTTSMMGGHVNDATTPEYSAQDALVSWWKFNTNISGSGEVNPPIVRNSVTGSIPDLGPYFTAITTPQYSPSQVGVSPSPLMQSGSNYFDNTPKMFLTSSTDSGGVLSFGNGGTDQAFSISTWFKFIDYLPAGGVVKGGIVSKNTSNTIFEYQLYTDGISTPSLIFKVGDSADASTAANYIGVTLTYAALPLVVGQWFHVVATYDGNGIGSTGLATMKLYVDSMEQTNLSETPGSPSTYAGMSAVSAMPLQVGALTKDNTFNGYIAEVAIWNKALTQEEISAIDPRHGGTWTRDGTAITTKSGVLGRPTATVKSVPRGFTYDNSLYGIDSVAFGGLLK